jgi:hypothetical protein
MFRRLSILAALVLMVVASAANAQKQGVGDPSQLSFFSGSTTLALSSDFAGALSTLEISAEAAFPGRLRRGHAVFPITTGTLDAATLRGEISHAGGLILSKNATRVRLESFVIDTTGAGGIVLTGLVSANGTVVGRIPLFDLALPSAADGLVDVTVVRLNGVSVTLRPEAAAALNAAFSTNAFVAGFDIGTASVFGTAFGI